MNLNSPIYISNILPLGLCCSLYLNYLPFGSHRLKVAVTQTCTHNCTTFQLFLLKKKNKKAPLSHLDTALKKNCNNPSKLCSTATSFIISYYKWFLPTWIANALYLNFSWLTSLNDLSSLSADYSSPAQLLVVQVKRVLAKRKRIHKECTYAEGNTRCG